MDVIRVVALYVLAALEDGLDLLAHHHREVAFRRFLAENPNWVVYELPPATGEPMTDPSPEPVPDENRFELSIVATGVVSEATPHEGETP